MSITFEPFSRFPRGTFYQLLTDAYAFDPCYAHDCDAKWQAQDAFFYDQLSLADRCGFITAVNGQAVGLICWDPRRLPETVQIGENCIRTIWKGKGLGRLQLQEALRRIRLLQPRRILVSTDEALIPAQRNYAGAGFVFTGYQDEPVPRVYAGRIMHYQIDLITKGD